MSQNRVSAQPLLNICHISVSFVASSYSGVYLPISEHSLIIDISLLGGIANMQ